MTKQQQIAIDNPCYFGFETSRSRFNSVKHDLSVTLTVNAGYESIEEGFGGPVWRVSVSHPMPSVRVQVANKTLEGVGAKSFGEWYEDGPSQYHIRRRLRRNEERMVGGLKDLRNTDEGNERFQAFLNKLSKIPSPAPMAKVFEGAARAEMAACKTK